MTKAPAGFSMNLSDEERQTYGARVSQEFQKYQYAVTYEKTETYTPLTYGSLPVLSGMIGKKPVKVTFFGDSITAGGDASGIHSVAPHQPGYAELVMAYLNTQHPGMWQSRNNSVGGWYMSDAVKAVRSRYPKTSILLVSSTLANPQSPLQKPRLLDSYQEILLEFAEEHDNVMLVDATSTWRKLLEHKSFYDITGNGLNHPNDFGHRVLAESVISALVGPTF